MMIIREEPGRKVWITVIEEVLIPTVRNINLQKSALRHRKGRRKAE